MTARQKELGYSSALDELHEIIHELESEEVDIDFLVEKVARASFLLKFCRDKLKGAEDEVRKIVSDMEQPKKALESDQ